MNRSQLKLSIVIVVKKRDAIRKDAKPKSKIFNCLDFLLNFGFYAAAKHLLIQVCITSAIYIRIDFTYHFYVAERKLAIFPFRFCRMRCSGSEHELKNRKYVECTWKCEHISLKEVNQCCAKRK